MRHDEYKYLYDILDSINKIEEYLEPIENMTQYARHSMAVDAVEKRLAVIGEAMNKIEKFNSDLPISNKKKIIGLRHILVHDYDMVDTATVWMICKKYLPELKREISLILDTNHGHTKH